MANAFSLQRRAIRSAANELTKSLDAARGEIQTSLDTQRKMYQPIVGTEGNTVFNSFLSLLGLNGTDPTEALRATPGYQFSVNEANKALERSAAAQGMHLSGNTLSSLARLNQGLADQQYNTRLGQLSGLLGAYTPLAAGAESAAANNFANFQINKGQISSDSILKQTDISILESLMRAANGGGSPTSLAGGGGTNFGPLSQQQQHQNMLNNGWYPDLTSPGRYTSVQGAYTGVPGFTNQIKAPASTGGR